MGTLAPAIARTFVKPLLNSILPIDLFKGLFIKGMDLIKIIHT